MPSGSTTFHEAEEHLAPATRDLHRAIVSLMEELEAVDWYQQRVDATQASSPGSRHIPAGWAAPATDGLASSMTLSHR